MILNTKLNFRSYYFSLNKSGFYTVLQQLTKIFYKTEKKLETHFIKIYRITQNYKPKSAIKNE